MTQKDFEEIIKNIVSESARLKNKYVDKFNIKVEFGDIFSQNADEYQQLTEVINKIGNKIYETPTGYIYSLNKPVKTIAGDLFLIKVRKPDAKLKYRGDADFNTEYQKLKEKFLNHPNFEHIIRKQFEMLRLSDPNFNVMTCFSNIPVRKWIIYTP